jgi:hypothetical protein
MDIRVPSRGPELDGGAEVAMSDAKRSVEEAREHLKKCLASEKFLGGQGLGSQLPIFVAAIEPREDLKLNDLGHWLVQQANLGGIHVSAFDLLDELASSLKAKGILDSLLASEQSGILAGPKLTEAIRSVTGLDVIVESKLHELNQASNSRAILITGLGSVFPFFRVNDLIAILENAQLRLPTIVFFPGEFSSSLRSPELKLFSTISEYYNYRAIDVFSYEP